MAAVVAVVAVVEAVVEVVVEVEEVGCDGIDARIGGVDLSPLCFRK